MEKVTKVKFEDTRYHVFDVAAFCLLYFEMNCFKLQKVLYYIQAAFIVKKMRPCFVGKIVRAKFGPVIPSVDEIYSIFGDQIISLNPDEFIGDISKIEEEDRKLITQVCRRCENLNESDLSIKTHEEDPWKQAKDDETISCISIYMYYNQNQKKLLI